MVRKTVEVEQVRGWVNDALRLPDSVYHMDPDMTIEQAFRLGACSLLEQILHATGNYKGFRDLPYDEARHRPDAGPDYTRRYYYGR